MLAREGVVAGMETGPKIEVTNAEAGAAIADYIQYATPNKAAKALLPDEYTKNPAIFPPDSVVAISEAAIYQGEDHQRVIDETWTRIQAA